MTFATWLGFLLAAIVIAVTPGPGAVISMSTGMRHGYWAALTAILGLQAAILLQLAVVGLGIGALLAASEAAFLIVKFVGAAYLVWLGIQKWRAAPVPVDVNAPTVRRKTSQSPAVARITTAVFIRFGPAPIAPRRPAVPNLSIPDIRSSSSSAARRSPDSARSTRLRSSARSPASGSCSIHSRALAAACMATPWLSIGLS